MNCPKCGRPVRKEQSVCGYCGARLLGRRRRRAAAKPLIALLAVAAILGLCLLGVQIIRQRQSSSPELPAPSGQETLPDSALSETPVPVVDSAADPAADPTGRWLSGDGTAELVIWQAEGDWVNFSLYSPGHPSLNLVDTVLGDAQGFTYADPYHQGQRVSGSLFIADAALVLSLREGSQDFPTGELRFSLRCDEPDYETLYAPVLDAYRDYEARGGGLENWYGEEEGNYVHAGFTGVTRVGYMFWDLDSDGVPELLLSPQYTQEQVEENPWLSPNGYYSNLIMDLYTLRDGLPCNVLFSGERYRYSLTDDGHIYYSGSSGASYTDTYLYDYVAGELHLVDGVCMDGGEEHTYQVRSAHDETHQNDLAISYEEYVWQMECLYRYTESKLGRLQCRPLLP